LKLRITPTHTDQFGNTIIGDSHVDLEVEDHNGQSTRVGPFDVKTLSRVIELAAETQKVQEFA